MSFVTGPVFFALIKTSIEKGFYAGVALAAGVLFSDVFYVALTLYGSSYLALESEYRIYIGITGSIILASIGIYYLLKKVKITPGTKITKRHKTGYFFKGFLMCIFNPGILLYWISVTSGFISVAGKIEPGNIIPFFASILITQFSMDITKAHYANKLRHRIKEGNIVWFNRIAGILMLIFALKLMYNLIFTQTLM